MTTLIEQFKAFYARLDNSSLAELDKLYSENIQFRDPVHEVKGLQNLHAYLAGMMKHVQGCEFHILRETLLEDRAFLTWDMRFRHPRLKGGNWISVHGISELHFDSRITYHEDYFDTAAMIYHNLPLLGRFLRSLRRRLS